MYLQALTFIEHLNIGNKIKFIRRRKSFQSPSLNVTNSSISRVLSVIVSNYLHRAVSVNVVNIILHSSSHWNEYFSGNINFCRIINWLSQSE